MIYLYVPRLNTSFKKKKEKEKKTKVCSSPLPTASRQTVKSPKGPNMRGT